MSTTIVFWKNFQFFSFTVRLVATSAWARNRFENLHTCFRFFYTWNWIKKCLEKWTHLKYKHLQNLNVFMNDSPSFSKFLAFLCCVFLNVRFSRGLFLFIPTILVFYHLIFQYFNKIFHKNIYRIPPTISSVPLYSQVWGVMYNWNNII